jgi:hypothetical protein
MYFQILGGSALLHLLIGHPRLVALLGIVATVALTSAPLGPGRYAGTGEYLDRIDAAMTPGLESTIEMQERALRAASDMLEHERTDEIEAAVDYTLRKCGHRCVDLTTPIIVDNLDLLKGVLILYELDKLATESRAAGDAATPAHAPETTAQ